VSERFTSGRVSPAARKTYLRSHPSFSPESFTRVRGGYIMHAWESQIDFARAGGRGYHIGSGEPVHPFDAVA
jgi:hypothetical protein